MIKPILKHEIHKFGDQEITFYEMSALGSLEYRQYVAENSFKETDDQLQIERRILDIYTRAIAHSIQPGFAESSIIELQNQLKTACDQEAIAKMHEVVRELQGWRSPQEMVEQTTAEAESETTESEGTPNPKS